MTGMRHRCDGRLDPGPVRRNRPCVCTGPVAKPLTGALVSASCAATRGPGVATRGCARASTGEWLPTNALASLPVWLPRNASMINWRDPGIGMSAVARHRGGGGDHEAWRQASSGRYAGPCGSGRHESGAASPFSVAGRGYLRFDDGHPRPSSNRKCPIYGTRALAHPDQEPVDLAGSHTAKVARDGCPASDETRISAETARIRSNYGHF
jgi:hypothetical protein